MARRRIHIEPSDISIGIYDRGRSFFVERVNDQRSVERCFELEDVLRGSWLFALNIAMFQMMSYAKY